MDALQDIAKRVRRTGSRFAHATFRPQGRTDGMDGPLLQRRPGGRIGGYPDLMTMAPNSRVGVHDATSDPFSERSQCRFSAERRILGGHFRFESNSEALLDLVRAAYDGLPKHRLPMDAPSFHIELQLVSRQATCAAAEPPAVRMQSGAGMLCGVMDASNYMVLTPARRSGLVVASEDMLDRPYHVRYELIEFAVFTLAARGLGLVPLHAACVGRQGRGILLLGASGSGKSTLALHSLLHGLDVLAEDAVFVHPESLFATGVANYLHVQADALGFLDDADTRRWVRRAPRIRRRSGVEKFEADLRLGPGRLAPMPLELAGAVFLSGRATDAPGALVNPIPKADVAARLSADQPYAAGQPAWRRFEQRLVQQGVHELRRGLHPSASVDVVRQLLD